MEVLRFISQFKFVIGVPVGDVKIYEEFDGEYTTNSKRYKKEEQVKFRLLVYGKEIVKKRKKTVVYFARATNLDLSKRVLKLYNKVRGPTTSYRNIKASPLHEQQVRLPRVYLRAGHDLLLALHLVQGRHGKGGVQASSHPLLSR